MREKIKMVSSAGTGHYYTTHKNKRTTPDKPSSAINFPSPRTACCRRPGRLRKLLNHKRL